MFRSATAGHAAIHHRAGLGLIERLRLWIEVAGQRRHLLELDDHLLADIGLNRDTARIEAARPFWDLP
ncbi:MAG TPA: DUF1127 domain-containing protein [Paracoccaceae bacterium]|nr:DUF1127 domain-containing protein [Paracoccaceae bacterium]